MYSLTLNKFKNSMNLFLLLTLYRQNNMQNNPQRLLFICLYVEFYIRL